MFFRSGLQKFGLKIMFRLDHKRDWLTFSIILIPYLLCNVPSKATMSHLEMQFLEFGDAVLGISRITAGSKNFESSFETHISRIF